MCRAHHASRLPLLFNNISLYILGYYLQQSAAMQSETTSRMDKMASALTEMTKSRDKAMGELCTINDRARKLLYSLGLSNALLHTSNAIDHARNLALERRRNGSVRLMQVDNKNGEMKGEISEEIPVHSQEKQNPDSSQSSEHGALPKQINTEGASIASLSGRLSPRHEEFAPYRSADNPGERGETSMKPLEIKRVYWVGPIGSYRPNPIKVYGNMSVWVGLSRPRPIMQKAVACIQ